MVAVALLLVKSVRLESLTRISTKNIIGHKEHFLLTKIVPQNKQTGARRAIWREAEVHNVSANEDA